MISIAERANIYDIRGTRADFEKIVEEGFAYATNGSTFLVLDELELPIYIYDEEKGTWGGPM